MTDISDYFGIMVSEPILIDFPRLFCFLVLKKDSVLFLRNYYDKLEKPWVMQSILVSLATRHILYKKSKLCYDISDVNIQKTNIVLRKGKIKFLSDHFKKHTSDSLW